MPKIGCLEYVQAASNDAALALIQSGQVDWTHNFVPNVEKAYEAKDPAHYHAFYANRDYPVSLVFDDTQYPYSLRRLPQGASASRSTATRSGSSASTATSRRPTRSASAGSSRSWVTDKSVKALAKSMATYDPAAAKKTLTDAGFTYKGSTADRPEGQRRQARHPRDLGLVGLGRLEPDHHEEPAGDRHRLERRSSRPRLGRLVPERVLDEEPDAALAGRLARLAVRLLLREPLAERVHPVRAGRDARPATGSTSRHDRRRRCSTSGRGRSTSKKQQQIATKLEKIFLQQLPIIPLLIGAAVVDVQHEVLPLLPDAEELLRRPDLHHVSPTTSCSFTRICPGGKAGT